MSAAGDLACLLAEIADAERAAWQHDRSTGTTEKRDAEAAAAQQADERAEAARRAARALIENAFPGVRWTAIARAL